MARRKVREAIPDMSERTRAYEMKSADADRVTREFRETQRKHDALNYQPQTTDVMNYGATPSGYYGLTRGGRVVDALLARRKDAKQVLLPPRRIDDPITHDEYMVSIGLGSSSERERALRVRERRLRLAGALPQGVPIRWVAEPHSSPSHHLGPCDEACRSGERLHAHKAMLRRRSR